MTLVSVCFVALLVVAGHFLLPTLHCRPEKLEYKEIVTPSWRVVETSEPLPPLPPPPMEQVLLPPVENGEEVEVCPRRSHRMVGKRDGGKRPKSAQDEVRVGVVKRG